MDDKTLIRAAIDASGMSARRFAMDVLLRDERTVRRWVAGRNPIPHIVRQKLLGIIANLPPPADP